MFSKLINNSILYVQIWEQRIKISDKKRGVIYDEQAALIITSNAKKQQIVGCTGDAVNAYISTEKCSLIKPFCHPRTLISDFIMAEKLLQHAVKTCLTNNFVFISPTIIIHPMEKLEGGLTSVEKRAFQELALGAGARDCIVYEGDVINLDEYRFKTEREQAKEKDSSITQKLFFGAVILIVTAILFSPIIVDLLT